MTSDIAQTLLDAGQCPLCGRPNHCALCAASAWKGPCWCMNTNIPVELLARVPADLRNKACICEMCVTEFQQETMSGKMEQPDRGTTFPLP